VRKVNVLFFAVAKSGGTASAGVRRVVEDAGMLIFRLMLWTAILCAIYLLVRTRGSRRRSLRVASWVFLSVVVACAIPFLAGFAYTRHVSILIYPAALFCCRLLCNQDGSSNTNE
jgi:hypothetical protein